MDTWSPQTLLHITAQASGPVAESLAGLDPPVPSPGLSLLSLPSPTRARRAKPPHTHQALHQVLEEKHKEEQMQSLRWVKLNQ